jgi:coenzyme F420 biosynthesis associated uncharacterized protein
MMSLIDWSMAQRIGERVAGNPPGGGVELDTVQPQAQRFAMRVAECSRLPDPQHLPPIEAVDRPEWIAANLTTMQPLLAPLEDRAGERAGLFAAQLQLASGAVMGAQVGALTGLLSQRVLGQYDLALVEPRSEPRLLLLAPNLVQAARNMGLPRGELVLWVTIHEITHAVQFEGAPWLRDYLGSLVSSLLDSVSDGPKLTWPTRLPSLAELREGAERAGAGDLLRVTLGEDRWQAVEQIQAAMSLIEGHAEYVMDEVGEDFLPSLERMRAALNRRRGDRGLSWRLLERLLGLELKMRQYQVGRRFCDAVVERGGLDTLALAWRSAEQLPTLAELERPDAWIARVSAEPAVTL